MRTRTKKMGKSSPGVLPNAAKTYFVFFHHQYNAAFRTLILHRFRPCLKQQTNRRAGAYTREKFPEFLRMGACYQRTARTAEFRVTGIISGVVDRGATTPPPNKGHSVVNTTTFSRIFKSRKILCASGS